MTEDPIIELIAKQSKARLDEIEKELDQLLRRTRFELELVRKAIVLKHPELRRETAPSRSYAASPRRRGNGRSNKRAPIKRIMESAPEREWRPGEISRALAEQGVSLSRDGTRVTMNRMVETHELVKLGEKGGYVLASHAAHEASANGSAPEAEEREKVLG